MAQLGKYDQIAEIARGGMGVVTLAVANGPAGFSKLLVIKELRSDLADDPAFATMFFEEARLAARLSHPNVVHTYEVGVENGRYFMVMDYLDGVPLAGVLRKKHPSFTVAMQLRVACEVLQGLHYAHTLTDFDGTPLGVVHRDATPQNVFLTYDGQIKLIDFGISKVLDSSVETRAGVLKGKPAYMAPEQITGNADSRADVFSVGVMLWEAVAGHRMWRKVGDLQVLTRILKGDLPSLAEAAPDAPKELVAIIDRALSIDRDDRHASAKELQLALEGYLSSTGENVTAREVCDFAASLFADERAKRRSMIESCLQKLRSGESLMALKPQPPITESSLTTGSRGPSRTPLDAEVPIPVHVEAGEGGKRALTIAMAGGAVAVLALAVVIGMRPWREPAAPAVPVLAAAPPPPAEVVPAPAATGTTHEVAIHVSPPIANVTVDGVPTSNPVTKTCAHGDRILLHAAAPGHVPRDRELVCVRSETIEIALAQTARTVAVAAPAAPPPPPRKGNEGAPEAPAPPPPPQPGMPGAATIDTGNPWK